jgi:hypothetical protein
VPGEALEESGRRRSPARRGRRHDDPAPHHDRSRREPRNRA